MVLMVTVQRFRHSHMLGADYCLAILEEQQNMRHILTFDTRCDMIVHDLNGGKLGNHDLI